jgi:hypothetical protein
VYKLKTKSFLCASFLQTSSHVENAHNMATFRQVHTTAPDNRVFVPQNSERKWLSEPLIWKLLLLTALAHLVWGDQRDVAIAPVVADGAARSESAFYRAKASMLQFAFGKSAPSAGESAPIILAPEERHNLTFAIDPGFEARHDATPEEVAICFEKCRAYIARFGPIAVAEMRRTGIPASVTLAQGLLQSNAGDDPLVARANNHFGIRCFAKHCKRGHCVAAGDGSQRDFFVRYPMIWGSFRAHAQALQRDVRCAPLFQSKGGDCHFWARGLAAAGYSTDERYADKLLAIIRALELQRLDERGLPE